MTLNVNNNRVMASKDSLSTAKYVAICEVLGLKEAPARAPAKPFKPSLFGGRFGQRLFLRRLRQNHHLKQQELTPPACLNPF